MAIYRMDTETFVPVSETSFAAAGLREREDLQRRIRADVSIIAPDVMVITEEFADWADSSRRIDLLCLDRDANLVIVELKRTDDAGHADLQALRYAAMVSSMTFRQLVDAHAKYKRAEPSDAEAAVLAFLGWDEPTDEEFGKDVRIVLAAADFSKEVTTTVLWLNERGIDLRCVRLKPYSLADGTVLVDAQQIIPLPEASEYLTKLADKRDEERKKGPRHALRLEFWTGVLALAGKRGAPHANRSPTEQSWIGKGGGVSLNYAIRAGDVQVEIYIDRGDKDANLRSLAFLTEKKDQIEKLTGPLFWDDLPDSRACRVSQSIEGGWKSPKPEWPAIQSKMIDAALAMDRAFRDLLTPAAAA